MRFHRAIRLYGQGNRFCYSGRVDDGQILFEPTPGWEPYGRTEGWDQRFPYDGSRYEIYRMYFTAEALADEPGGRTIFAGGWVVMVAAGR